MQATCSWLGWFPADPGLQCHLVSFQKRADQTKQRSIQANFRLPLTCLPAML